jgi:hypothetical protein
MACLPRAACSSSTTTASLARRATSCRRQRRLVWPTGTLEGALCLRNLVTGTDASGARGSRRRVNETRRNGNLRGKPTIIVHGRADALLPVNHTSRPYAALNKKVEGDASKLSYMEVANAQHFDSFIGLPTVLPGYDSRYVPAACLPEPRPRRHVRQPRKVARPCPPARWCARCRVAAHPVRHRPSRQPTCLPLVTTPAAGNAIAITAGAALSCLTKRWHPGKRGTGGRNPTQAMHSMPSHATSRYLRCAGLRNPLTPNGATPDSARGDGMAWPGAHRARHGRAGPPPGATATASSAPIPWAGA